MSKWLIKIAGLTFLGVILVILPLVGCDEDDEITAEHLAEKITAAAEDMETYQFDISSELTMIETNDETIESSMSAEVSGVVDKPNKKIQITWERELETQEFTIAMKTEQYFICDMLYTMSTTSDGGASPWTKAPATVESWWDGVENEVVEQLKLLEASEIESFDSEQVNGIECWAIKLMPNLELLWEQKGPKTGDEIPTDLDEIMKDISVKQWFATDTHFLMKAEMELTILYDAATAYMSSESEFSHYNESFSIELPKEAEDAQAK